MKPVTLRPRFGMVLTVVVALMATAGLVGLIVGDPGALARSGWGLALLAAVTWIGFWAPAVVVAEDAVTVRNPFRRVRVPWGAIERIDTRWSLRLHTPGRVVTAWSAPAPSRYAVSRATREDTRGLPESTYGAGSSIGLGDMPGSDSGLAAYHVRRRWEALRDAGDLDGRRGTVTTRWEWARVAIVAALALLTLVGLLLP